MTQHGDDKDAPCRPGPTTRPNGSVYRPRNPISVTSVAWNDDGWVVLVYGTHDADEARSLAQSEWDAEHDGPLPEPVKIWTKTVPWDAFGYGWDSTILQVGGNTKGSTPTLQYGYECPTTPGEPS